MHSKPTRRELLKLTPLLALGALAVPSLVNGEFGYRFNSRFQLVGEVYNLFDQEASDIDYFYTSRLLGEPPEGVDDIHTHPALPRTLRVSLRVGF